MMAHVRSHVRSATAMALATMASPLRLEPSRAEETKALGSMADQVTMAPSNAASVSVAEVTIAEAPSIAAAAYMTEAPSTAARAYMTEAPSMAAQAYMAEAPGVAAHAYMAEAPSTAARAYMTEAPSMAEASMVTASVAEATVATISVAEVTTATAAENTRRELAIVMATRVNESSTMANVELTLEGREFPVDLSTVTLSRHVFRLAKQDVTELNAVLSKRSTAVSHADSILSSLALKESLRCRIPEDLDRGGVRYSLPLGCAALSSGVGAFKQTVCDALFAVNVVDSRGASVALGQRAVYTCLVMQEVSAVPADSPSEQAMLVGSNQRTAGCMMRTCHYVYSKPPIPLQRRDSSPMFEQPDRDPV